MAASVCTSGLAAPAGSTSSSATAAGPATHRPCALSFPTSGAAAASSSSKLLDELAEVACSPQSPLMKAVQAVWPDFNLPPVDSKTAVNRRPSGHINGNSAVPGKAAKPTANSSGKLPGTHKSKSRGTNGRKMAAENGGSLKHSQHAGGASASAGALFTPEQLDVFSDIPAAALRCFQGGCTLLAMQTDEQTCGEWIPTEVLRQHYPADTGTSPAAKDIAEMTRLRVVDCHMLARDESGGSQTRVRLTLRVLPTSHQIVANCPVSHPYLVEKKGEIRETCVPRSLHVATRPALEMNYRSLT